MAVHIGQLIEQELIRQQRGKAWFARQICCTRENVYRILKSDNIDYQLLRRISFVLNYNFFAILAQDTTTELQEYQPVARSM